LVVRGLVTRQGRGVVVADPEFLSPPGADLATLAAQTSIKQLFEVRKLLEVRVAGWAAMRATARNRRKAFTSGSTFTRSTFRSAP